MGVILLFIAVLIEIAFTVSCICTKSNQIKIRSIMRIIIFVLFLISLLTGIIKWNFRVKAFAVLLFIWAVLGIVALIRNKAEKKEFKYRKIIRKAICMVLLVIMALTPALVFPEYKMIETTGTFKVSTDLYTYIDKSRVETYTDTGENRKLNVEFWYPEDTDETYPLIIFSHGAFGIKTSNESLFNELASHGYVVCSIDHTYQSLCTTDVDGNKTWIDKGFMKELTTEDAKADKQQSYEYYKKWMGICTGDINFVIDHILAEAGKNDADAVYKLVDKRKIGVMGHSLGGSAALGIGRSRNDVSAVIALESPFMCDIMGVQDNEFIFTDEKYPVPVLNIYSDSSWSHLSEWAQYKENNFLLAGTNKTAFNVHIQGTGHLTLTDLALMSPILTTILNGKISNTDSRYCLKTINKLTLSFFDYYLKGEGNFSPDSKY